MTNVTDRHNPSFALFPINNNRTAWKPVSLPIILVEPDKRDSTDAPIDNSQVLSVRISIENTPRQSRVAGHDNVGLFSPDAELYAITIDQFQLIERKIEIESAVFYNTSNVEIDYEDAVLGDSFSYTTISGTTDTLTYIPSADYYDLSDLTLEVENLPSGYYYLSYQVSYYPRITSGTSRDQLICIDVSRTSISVQRSMLNHPGEVLEETYRHTPVAYLTQANKSQDSTIEFLRPFTDMLQDIYDEQSLLEEINWVDKITPSLMPYLSFLLGIELPYFPNSLDKLRRTMMRNVVRLQQLKGSRRALVELFELFGYTIYIANLYWTSDGKKLFRPGQTLSSPYTEQEIAIVKLDQIEPIIANYTTDGFGELTIPLLFRPTLLLSENGVAYVYSGGDILIDSYLVEVDSESHLELIAIQESMDLDPSGYGGTVDDLPTIVGEGVIGHSQINISDSVVDVSSAGAEPPISASGVKFDRDSNILRVTFNSYIKFHKNDLDPSKKEYVLFSFASYQRYDFEIPEEIKDLRSNRFDIQMLTKAGEDVTPNVLEFLIAFLIDIKAFHSLLNVITYNQDLNETYAVTDFCVGGDYETRYDTDAGRLQVPPAILPVLPDNNCDFRPESLGYKDSDKLLRERILTALAEEHAAWKRLDSRSSNSQLSSRLHQPVESTRTECKFNDRGQDIIIPSDKSEDVKLEFGPGPNSNNPSEMKLSPIVDVVGDEFKGDGQQASTNGNVQSYGSFEVNYTVKQEHLCDLSNGTDYCYKGRVSDELLHQAVMLSIENVRLKQCQLSLGTGFYYTLPVPSVSLGYKKYSGNAQGPGIKQHLTGPQGRTLSHNYNIALSSIDQNLLGRLLWSYGNPTSETIHYFDRNVVNDDIIDQRNFLALQRPSLNIEKSNLHFPGTRFISMSHIENDFVHEEWEARPWDTQYSTVCGVPCDGGPTYLNARLVEDEYGDYVLVYDSAPYTIRSTNSKADIPNLNCYELDGSHHFGSSDVVHKIYTSQYDGHEAIELEQLGSCDGTDIGTGAESVIGNTTVLVNSPLFKSAANCGTDGYIDYCDGYPCESGEQYTADLDIDRSGVYNELFLGMGLLLDNVTDVRSIFLLGSGIKDGTLGYRLDCDCDILDCGYTDSTRLQSLCQSDLFVDQDGDRDWGFDQLEYTPAMILQESVGVNSFRLNGEIPSLFEMLD